MNNLLSKLSVSFIASATIVFGQVVLQDTFSYDGGNQQPTDLGGGVYGYEIDTTGFSAAGHKLVLSYSTKSEQSENVNIGIDDDIGGA